MRSKMKKNKEFYTRSPYNKILQAIALIETLFFKLPILLIYFIVRPDARPHQQWSLFRCLFISLFRSFRARTRPLKMYSANINKTVMPNLGSKADATGIWIPSIDPKIDLQGDFKTFFEAASCTVLLRNLVFWYGRDHSGKQGRRAITEDEKVILYFHGGGYVEQNSTPSNPTINCLRILLSASAKSTTKITPKRALAVEYRMTDETSFPGILADALSAWKYLIDQGFKPSNIVISGDSAGGNLTLALTRYLIQYRPFYSLWKGISNNKEEVADGIILFSPWIDISLSFCESSNYKNAKSDYLGPTLFNGVVIGLLDGLPNQASSNRLLSSLCKKRKVLKDDFDAFPRALIFGASLEVLIDEIRALDHHLNIAAEAGRCKPSTFFEHSLATHDWCALPFGFAGEQKRTLQQVTQWI